MGDRYGKGARLSGAALGERIEGWLIGSDPGLLRLQVAIRTTLTLAVSLGVLVLLTTLTGEPLTVALLGVVIAMMSAMAVNDPDPRQQNITMALLPVPAAISVTLGALLAPHLVMGDVVFVLIIFAAVYIRRFGGRGMALGMVAVMTYFFALFLGAKVGQLPWLIGAVVVGTACSFLMRTYVFPDRPERVLHRTLRALWARIGAVVDATADAVQAGKLGKRQWRRIGARTARLNQTALMVENQLEEKVDAAALWPGVEDSELMLRLFDSELAAEGVAVTGSELAAVAEQIPAETRTDLVHALRLLADALRGGAPADPLEQADRLARHSLPRHSAGHGPDPTDGENRSGQQGGQLALAMVELVAAANRTRALAEQTAADPAPGPDEQPAKDESGDQRPDDADQEAEAGEDEAPEDGERASTWIGRLDPTTRQAIQVSVAASLAIVAGELLSPARWYWAVIAAFVIFNGTTSRGETLSRGWQRMLGTILGVPAGVLVATAVGGNVAWSLVLIFVCIFSGFYFLKVAYSLMMFWITTMLALLYGLLGQFSVGVLVLRIEETAVGAGIGVLVATLVLPTSTRATIADTAGTFLTTLGDLVRTATDSLGGDADAGHGLTEQARRLGQQLQEVHTSAQPLTDGIAGITGSTDTRHGIRALRACDHYARTLARACDRPTSLDPGLGSMITSATEQVSCNLDTLTGLLDRREPVTVGSARSLLDRVENAAHRRNPGGRIGDEDERRIRVAVRSLRQIDQAVVDLCLGLGADTADERAPTVADPT